MSAGGLFLTQEHGVSLDEITISVHGKFNCITVNFDRTQHDIHYIPTKPGFYHALHA